jgi:hypothetical protein
VTRQQGTRLDLTRWEIVGYNRINLTKEKEMTIERQGNGSLLISDIVNGYYVKKVYYFYSKKEAIKLFREYIKEVKND